MQDLTNFSISNMNKRCKKAIKITAITLTTLILGILAIIAIAIHFIFTPEKLTPVVVNAANQSLQAKLDLKRVELTFFSTFPQFGLEITEGSLVSKAHRDTCWQHTDSLVTFRRCLVELRPLDYLTQQKINIKEISLEDAHVYAFRDREGKANWDIVRPDSIPQDTTTESSAPVINEIAVDRIHLDRSYIVFDDRNTRVYTRMDSVNLDLHALLRKKHYELDLHFNNKNLLFWQNDELLANHIRTDLQTALDLNLDTQELTLGKTSLEVNGIRLDVAGKLGKDSLEKAVNTDLTYTLHAPSMKTVLEMIPESIVRKDEVDAQGEVRIEGHIQGKYGQGNMPKSTLAISIKNASAHYAGMPYGIDDVEMDFKAYIDLMRETPSYADLRIFRFEGAHTKILADARINHLLGDPDITFNVKSKIDLTALAQTFPLQEGVRLQGGVVADLSSHCRLSDLKKQNYGRINMNGQLQMKDLRLTAEDRNFDFQSDAQFHFTGKESLEAELTINQIDLQSRLLNASIQQMKAAVKSDREKDTTRIFKVHCELDAHSFKASSGDSLVLFTKQAKAKASLHPGTKRPEMPEISVSLDTDTLYTRLGQRKLAMDKGGFGIKAEKLNDSIWLPSGIIGFHSLGIRTPELKLPIRFQRTAVTVKDQKVMLKRAHMKIGNSDLMATGAIFNVYDALKHNQPIRAQLDIHSSLLDGNQLINALNTDLDATEELDTLSNEAPMELFVIPGNIDFELQTQLDKVVYGKMVFEQVHGAVDVRDQAVHLKDLSMRGLDADMKATLVYHAKDKRKGFTGFDFKLEDVNIGKLVDFIPALDSIVPMLRSFKGIVDFDATAEAQLDSALNLQIPTLRSAVHIKGDSLVLMDGETFAEISKMMMFKNKKRNLIDSIYVNMTIDNGNVTVYPFVVQMDRYRAAVGGTQDLDMNFKYHISVLKSPVPFKLGVNITGNLDKMKFRVGKAKYKDQVTPVAIRKVDSTRINLGKDIIQDFEKVLRNAKK